MVIEEIRNLLRAHPFQQFTVLTSDGREVLIHHHDHARQTPGGYTLYVSDTDGRIHHLSTQQITRVSHDDAPNSPAPGVTERP